MAQESLTAFATSADNPRAADTDAETQTFEFEDTEKPTVTIAHTYQSKYGSEKAVLVGDTYEAFTEEGLKDEIDWEETHLSWSDPLPHFVCDAVRTNKAWTVDANEEALTIVRETLKEAGFAFEECAAGSPLQEIVDVVDETVRRWDEEDGEVIDEEGSTISVTYEQAKGNWNEETVSGLVSSADDGVIKFHRDSDGHLMTVKLDDNRKPALFTTGSQYPFMGPVREFEVE